MLATIMCPPDPQPHERDDDTIRRIIDFKRVLLQKYAPQYVRYIRLNEQLELYERYSTTKTSNFIEPSIACVVSMVSEAILRNRLVEYK